MKSQETSASDSDSNPLKKLSVLTGAAALGGGAFWALEQGQVASIDAPSVVDDTHFDPVNSAVRLLDTVIETGSPAVTGFVVGSATVVAFSQHLGRRGQTLAAHRDMALSEPSSSKIREGFFGQHVNPGILLGAALASALGGSNHALRESLVNDPVTSVESFEALIVGDGDTSTEKVIILDNSNTGYQEDSSISVEQQRDIEDIVNSLGGIAIPHDKYFVTIDFNAGNPSNAHEDSAKGLILEVPTDALGENGAALINEGDIYLDDAGFGIEEGEMIVAGNNDFRVTRIVDDAAFFNRMVGVADLDLEEKSEIFGVIVDGVDAETVQAAIDPELSAITMNQFSQNNEEAWKDNTVNIITLMSAQMDGLATAFVGAQWMFSRERNKKYRNSLNKNGFDRKHDRLQAAIKGIHSTIVSGIVSLPLMYGLTETLSASSAGLRAKTTLESASVGMTWAAVASLGGSIISLAPWRKKK